VLREALHAQTLGIEESLRVEKLSDSPLANAYQGRVQSGDQWLTIDELLARLGKDDKLAAYREQQSMVRENAQSHVALANWCRERGLPDQERAHLLRALDFDPDNGELRMRLGHVKGERQWQSPEELAQQRAEERKLAEAKEQWLPQLQELRRRIVSGRSAAREEALELMRNIRDPLAVPSLELAFEEDRDLPLLIETLANIDDPRAIAALVRIAVDGKIQGREAAVKELAKLDQFSYVPLLLGGLRQPIVATTLSHFDPQGNFVYTQRFQRGAENHDEVLDLAVVVDRNQISHTSFRDLQARTRVEEIRLGQTVREENAKIEQRNVQIISVLKATTGANVIAPAAQNLAKSSRKARSKSPYERTTPISVSASPQQWWDWWKSENEIVDQRIRGTQRIQRTTNVSLDTEAPFGEAEPIPDTFRGSADFISPREQQRCECFVAGTPVWTSRGKVAIETIRTGELVLTQNMQSGQLEFKPVVRPTTRPAMALVQPTIGSDTFTCTGGHLFWVVEQGWVKARDLKPGMVVHGASGSAAVTGNDSGGWVNTFNLVVADNHNYFVGQSRLLTHDNTPRQATSLVAPGVPAEEEP
jgi:hypothetical protein